MLCNRHQGEKGRSHTSKTNKCHLQLVLPETHSVAGFVLWLYDMYVLQPIKSCVNSPNTKLITATGF